MIILILILVGCFIVATQAPKPKLFLALFVGYLINLALIFTQRYVRPIFYSSDQQRFIDLAKELSSLDFFSFLMQFDPTGSYLISWFAALVFKALGDEPLYVNFFFVYAWIGTVIFSYKLVLLIAENKNFAFIVSFFLIFTPSISIVNAAFLRESFVIFFLVISVYYSYLWYMTNKLNFFVASIVFMTLAGFFHGAFYFLSAFLVLIYFKERLLRSRIRYYDLLLVFFLILILIPASIQLASNVKVEMAFSLLSGEERVVERYLSSSEVRSDGEGINSLLLPTLDISNPVYFIVSLVERIAFFSTSPFVHNYYKITDVPRIYDSLIFILSIVLLFAVYKKGWNSNERKVKFYFKLFVPMILLLMLMFSLGSFDVGTSQRHRLKFMPIFMVVTLSMYYATRVIAKKKKLGRIIGG